MTNRLLSLVILITTVITGCSQTPNASSIAAMQRDIIAAEHFKITTFSKLTNENDTLHVYLEGDGRAWLNRYQLASNPTPKNTTGLNLAAIDSHPKVLYIARPCQFTPLALDPYCSNKYWSNSRYAPEIVADTNEILNIYKQKLNCDKIRLFGFSGGANIAVLLADMRQDVASITTFAGNLDHDALTAHHRTTPLDGSLNCIKSAAKLGHIPQLHYIGTKDRVVPSYVTAKYIELAANPKCVKMQQVANQDHAHWEQFWHKQHLNHPSCEP